MEDPSEGIRIEQIRIENVFGVRELEFDPDGVTVIRGDNDTGKTSVLRAISLLLGGGHDPEALRKGAEKGEVRFTLGDGTEVYARLTENDTYYRIEGREDVTARQLLEAIQDEISVNPIQILQARPQDRGQILLEAMPMAVDNERISEALSPLSGEWPAFPYDVEDFEDTHALKVLGDKSSGFIGTLYEERQEMHGAKRDKQGTVNDLQEAVGDHDDPEALKSRRDRVEQDLKTLHNEREKDINGVNEWEKEQIEKIRDEANKQRSEIRDDFDDEITQKEKQRERLNERIEQAERAEQTVETLEERKKELDDLEERYDRLSKAIENLRSLKIDFADDLPEGVKIADDGEIVNESGIRFEHWNEQSQVEFAMRIAEMRVGELPLIPLDGIEKVVGEQREQLIEFARESDAQFVLTEAVAGEELTVERVE